MIAMSMTSTYDYRRAMASAPVYPAPASVRRAGHMRWL
jgi:hypothetical protein